MFTLIISPCPGSRHITLLVVTRGPGEVLAPGGGRGDISSIYPGTTENHSEPSIHPSRDFIFHI